VGTHIDECLNFAEAAGILSSEDLAQAKKVAPFLKNGETPGKCQTKAECDKYCANDMNFVECVGFAEKAGFISPEDAAVTKKVGGKGPGDCKGKDECMNYCNQDAHAEECANFAAEKGLLTKEQQDMIANGVDKLKAGLEQIPEEVRPEVTSCLEEKIGKEKFQKVLDKQATLTQAQGDSIQGCFANVANLMKEKMMSQSGGNIPSGAAGKAPSKEDIMKNIPENVPPEVRANIEKQIESQTGSGASVGAPMQPPSAGSMPTGAPAGAAPSISCSAFASAPSCDYVPEGPARDACEKCKQ
jgi:hypothetical protein